MKYRNQLWESLPFTHKENAALLFSSTYVVPQAKVLQKVTSKDLVAVPLTDISGLKMISLCTC